MFGNTYFLSGLWVSSLVGRVERSETRQDRTATLRLSGFASLYPTNHGEYHTRIRPSAFGVD